MDTKHTDTPLGRALDAFNKRINDALALSLAGDASGLATEIKSLLGMFKQIVDSARDPEVIEFFAKSNVRETRDHVARAQLVADFMRREANRDLTTDDLRDILDRTEEEDSSAVVDALNEKCFPMIMAYLQQKTVGHVHAVPSPIGYPPSAKGDPTLDPHASPIDYKTTFARGIALSWQHEWDFVTEEGEVSEELLEMAREIRNAQI